MLPENLSLFEAFRQVLTKHPQAMPHLALWKSLCEYYDEDWSYKDIFKLMRQQNINRSVEQFQSGTSSEKR